MFRMPARNHPTWNQFHSLLEQDFGVLLYLQSTDLLLLEHKRPWHPQVSSYRRTGDTCQICGGELGVEPDRLWEKKGKRATS